MPISDLLVSIYFHLILSLFITQNISLRLSLSPIPILYSLPGLHLDRVCICKLWSRVFSSVSSVLVFSRLYILCFFQTPFSTLSSTPQLCTSPSLVLATVIGDTRPYSLLSCFSTRLPFNYQLSMTDCYPSSYVTRRLKDVKDLV